MGKIVVVLTVLILVASFAYSASEPPANFGGIEDIRKYSGSAETYFNPFAFINRMLEDGIFDFNSYMEKVRVTMIPIAALFVLLEILFRSYTILGSGMKEDFKPIGFFLKLGFVALMLSPTLYHLLVRGILAGPFLLFHKMLVTSADYKLFSLSSLWQAYCESFKVNLTSPMSYFKVFNFLNIPAMLAGLFSILAILGAYAITLFQAIGFMLYYLIGPFAILFYIFTPFSGFFHSWLKGIMGYACWSVVGPLMFLILEKMGVWAALNGGLTSLSGTDVLDAFDATMFGFVTLVSLILIPKIASNLTGAAIESFTSALDTAKKAGTIAAGVIG